MTLPVNGKVNDNVALLRDVKPENIVLEGGQAGGNVYLVDFGGVQAAAMQNDFASTIIGMVPNHR